jgi:hypothetical protein
VKKFGALYEAYKGHYAKMTEEEQPLYKAIYKPNIDTIAANKKLIDEILVGTYRHENQEDWIYHSDGRKVNLANASSGQQEALPMLLILFFIPSGPRKKSCFIEEPEAHLFPIAQKYITQFFAYLYSTKDSDFLITTHSPYILTALNVLIKAGNLSSQTEDKSLLDKIDRVVERQFHVKYEDVAAYTIKDGRIESILNEEYKIIGSSIIDAISDEFEHEYNSLLELENEL